ncbi:MAG TPA: hypothetical protein VGI75_01110, partial [Pirellulales bacterium]
FALLIAARSLPTSAQQTTVTAPMHGLNDGFFENGGIGFNAAGRNWFFNGIGPAPAPFGNANPAAGANLGFGLGFPGGNAQFNFGAGQGSSTGLSSSSPSVTTMDGTTGYFANVTQIPFVVGLVPVVGGVGGVGGGLNGVAGQFGSSALPPIAQAPSLLDERLARIQGGELQLARHGGVGQAPVAAAKINPPPKHEVVAANDPTAIKLAQAKQSTAGTAAISIAALREQQRAEDEAAAIEIRSLLNEGRAAQAAGKVGAARLDYRQAVQRASGDLKHEAEEALRSLGDQAPKR